MQLMLPSLRRKRAEELLRVQHTVAQILAEPAEAAVLLRICAPPAPALPRCNTRFDQLTFRSAIVHSADRRAAPTPANNDQPHQAAIFQGERHAKRQTGA